MLLVEQLVHQRFAPSGPLVLGGDSPQEIIRPQRIKSELSHDVLNPAHVPF